MDLFKDKKENTYYELCRKCFGKGYIVIQQQELFQDIGADAVRCSDCKGKGYLVIVKDDSLLLKII